MYLFLFVAFCTYLLGKNAYALSVLRRVEMKIDGRDISESRYGYMAHFGTWQIFG